MHADGVVTHAVDAGHGPSGMMLATAVHVSGAVGGSLVASTDAGYGHIAEHRELLAAFAQQVNLALTDAQTVQAMRDAYHDSITGLPTRALFIERLKQALGSIALSRDDVMVLYIDLDHFKDVNDSLGHSAGDELLAEVGKRIRSCVERRDTVARLGGDEFAVMLDESDRAAAVELAEHVIPALRRPFRLTGRDVFIDASVGLASGATTRDPVELLRDADVAMYHAKKSGPGKLAVFEPYMHSAVLRRLELHTDLKYALALSELALQFQPLVRLDSAEPVGVEALLRWPHPRHGAVSPVDLVRIAEETGLIVEVGRFVLRQSAEQVAHWRSDLSGINLNVNVSAREIADPEFVPQVAEVLNVTGLPAEMMTLELTETIFMTDPDSVWKPVNQLKDLGVRLSVDDFGTGYSSLAYLCRLPVDQLKIDRSFVSSMRTSTANLAVVRTIIELANTLNLQTVAEGIENSAQLDDLRGLGCELGQGYHFARPLDPEAARAFLSRYVATAA